MRILCLSIIISTFGDSSSYKYERGEIKPRGGEAVYYAKLFMVFFFFELLYCCILLSCAGRYSGV